MGNVSKSLKDWFDVNKTYIGAAIMAVFGIYGHTAATTAITNTSWTDLIGVVLGGVLAVYGIHTNAQAAKKSVKKRK